MKKLFFSSLILIVSLVCLTSCETVAVAAEVPVSTEVIWYDTNNNLKGVVKKFLAAMAGVIISSVIIFILGVIFNKFNKFKTGKPEEFFEEKEEEVPPTNDENEALKTFFDITE